VPLHDATRDLVLLSEQFEAEYKLTRNLEILTDKLQQTYRELESEKQKTDSLLYSVLPQSVAMELRHQRPVAPKRYACVTLMFSGIVGFSQYCAANTSAEGAMKIVKMLNELYTIFDSLTDSKSNSNVYKVSGCRQRNRHRVSNPFGDLSKPILLWCFVIWTALRQQL